MFPYHAQPLYHQPGVSSGSHLQIRSQDVNLTLRQQPKEALVTTEGKEKARKPVDPPPIIQLHVKQQADPAQHFLQSPYLFMCVSLFKLEKQEAWDGNANRSLAGSLVSSLHRLKDVDNKDGGFFVFGDISVKVQGTFRLHFSLFDLHKDTSEVLYLGSITSEPFRVLLPKDFKGMEESTYLSRAFSDQGVRLRLRKEPRAMMGNKRPYPYSSDSVAPAIRPNVADFGTGFRSEPTTSPHKRPYVDDYGLYGDGDHPPNKRYRMGSSEDRKDSLPDNSTVVSGAGLPLPQSSLPNAYSMGQYSTFDTLGPISTPLAPQSSRYTDMSYSQMYPSSFWQQGQRS